MIVLYRFVVGKRESKRYIPLGISLSFLVDLFPPLSRPCATYTKPHIRELRGIHANSAIKCARRRSLRNVSIHTPSHPQARQSLLLLWYESTSTHLLPTTYSRPTGRPTNDAEGCTDHSQPARSRFAASRVSSVFEYATSRSRR